MNNGNSLPPGTSHLFSLQFWIPPTYPLCVRGGTFPGNNLIKLLPCLGLQLTIAHQAQRTTSLQSLVKRWESNPHPAKLVPNHSPHQQHRHWTWLSLGRGKAQALPSSCFPCLFFIFSLKRSDSAFKGCQTLKRESPTWRDTACGTLLTAGAGLQLVAPCLSSPGEGGVEDEDGISHMPISSVSGTRASLFFERKIQRPH